MVLGSTLAMTRLALAASLVLAFAMAPASAERLPPEKIRNPDPKAVSTGLHFHSSITPAQRKTLTDDLAWLSRKGPIPGSGLLSRVIGAGGGDVDGAKLVAWLFDKVTVVGGMSWDPLPGLVVLSNLAPERGIMVFANPKPPFKMRGMPLGLAFGETLPYSEPWRVAKEYQGEVDGFLVDGLILPAPRSRSPYMPIVRVDMDLIQKEVPGPAGRIERLHVLFHEAAHVAFVKGHVECRKKGMSVAGPHPFGDARIGTLIASMSNDCDPYELRTANVMSVAFFQAMAGMCEGCARDNALLLRLSLVSLAERVQTVVAKPFTIPKAGLSLATAKAFAGRPLDTVPSKLWFEATAAYLRAKWPDDAAAQRDLALIRTAVEAADASGAMRTPWADPGGEPQPFAGDVAGAKAWVQRATTGTAQPALTGMPPCSQFTIAKSNLEEKTPCGLPR